MIFLNYRKRDSQPVVDHLAVRLKDRFGPANVFIPPLKNQMEIAFLVRKCYRRQIRTRDFATTSDLPYQDCLPAVCLELPMRSSAALPMPSESFQTQDPPVNSRLQGRQNSLEG
jgi:hypothetical protein